MMANFTVSSPLNDDKIKKYHLAKNVIVVNSQNSPDVWDYIIDNLTNNRDKSKNNIGLHHLINPYYSSKEFDSQTQTKALTSIERARQLSQYSENIKISAVYEPGQELLVDNFKPDYQSFIDRNVLDIRNFEIPCKLPLVFDILEAGVKNAKPDDFIVFTNTDIILAPYFYDAVIDLLQLGFDAITINRNTISKKQILIDSLAINMAEKGRYHPGYDCLIFSVKNFKNFVTNQACLGRRAVMLGLVHNLVYFSKQMLMLKKANLTFHIGDDRSWCDHKYKDYTDFNISEINLMLEKLLDDTDEGINLLEYCKNKNNPERMTSKFFEKLGQTRQ
ncbi:MAG: hypothetical protein F6K55_44440 [Moorea sp. SIO4A3]|nr:hypothetical protein [Moorena sp. SIO4A3]